MDTCEQLILHLAGGLQPVKRLRSPVVRALLWLGVVGFLGTALVLAFHRVPALMERARDPKFALELVGTLATGILAVVAAFELSLPDRSLKWVLLPAPSLALWLCSSGYSCWRHLIASDPGQIDPAETTLCLAWIVGFGVPLAISLFLVLRRSHPIDPVPAAVMAGLGVASIAAFLLQFFHPYDVTFIDLGLHLAAVAIVIILARAAAYPALD